MLESTKKISSKIGPPGDEAAKVLEDMANRGLLYSLRREGNTYYVAIPFVHGICEFQVGRMDKELAELAFKFFYGEWSSRIEENAKNFLRIIPVYQTVDPTYHIAPFEDAVQILKSKDSIVATNCVCHTSSDLVNEK